MRKTFEADAALLRRMRATGGLSNATGLDAGKEENIRLLETQEAHKKQQQEVHCLTIAFAF